MHEASVISVIIPAHNESDRLGVLLPRLQALGHDGKQVEILVVLSRDTTDASEAIVRSQGMRVLRASGSGRAVQMNEGALEAQGSALAFLHADVLPPDRFYDDILQTLEAGYDAGFFSYRFQPTNAFLKINASFTSRDGIFTGGGDQCLFIRKATFQKLGGFDNAQVLMEDFELFRRMKRSNIPYRIVPNDLLVSSRKYQKNSYVRVNLSNLLLLVLFRCGCAPETLKRLHNRLIRPS